MRRKDKEIEDIKEMELIINRSDTCRIALTENNSPYIVPVCFGYRDNCLYFHSTSYGKKIDMIRKNNKVCFEFDINEGLIKSKNLCDWDVKYYSVIGFGKAFFINPEDKIKALNIIAEHYSGKYDYQKNSVNNVVVIKIEIDNITGKKSG